MGSCAYAVIVPVLVLVMVAATANSQTICNISIAGLESCVPAAQPPNPPPPTPECCAAMQDADYCCLYAYKNSPVLRSFGVDPNLALQIPDKCGIPHPSQC